MSNCTVCNSVIKSNRRGKKYCSNACKQRAYNDRKLQPKTSNLVFGVAHYESIMDELPEEYHVNYIEYQYILSIVPRESSDNRSELKAHIKAILDDAFNTTEEAKSSFGKNLNLFRDKFYTSRI